MQARPKIFRIFAVALIASLMLSACGGGTSGSTWFNLPAIPIQIQLDGSATALGFNIGPVLPPATLQQLQAAKVQNLTVRIGYNGIHVYANGADLPYISWDADSVATLQELIQKMPNVPNASTIANLLPWLRRVGLGVNLSLPPGQGEAAANAASWRGETTVATEQAPATPTIGPFQLGSIAFDKSGGLNIGSVPGSALGLPANLLDANTLGLLQSIGLDKLQIKTEPNGIKLSLNDKPLPSIAYDSKSLEQVKPLVGAFAPAMAPLLDNLLPKLQGAALDLAVSFTGQPAQETKLATLPVTLNPDGTLGVFGITVPGNPIVPPDVLQKLQAANVQNLNVDVGQEGVFLAANGQTLPTITWTPDSMATVANVIAPALGINADLINNGLAVMKEMGGSIKATVALGAGGAVSGTVPAEINKTFTVSATESAPIIRLNGTVQQGMLQAVEGIGSLADVGLPPVSLPPNITDLLGKLGAKQVQLATDPGHLNILLDGKPTITLNYDQAALDQALTLATPFLDTTPLKDPNLQKFVKEQLLPQLPSSQVNVTLNLQ